MRFIGLFSTAQSSTAYNSCAGSQPYAHDVLRPASGAAIAISKVRHGPMRVGVIGLGTGTLAALGRG